MPGKDERQGKDHHLGLRFWVQIEGVEIAGFSEVSGLSIETETFEYAEGGLNTFTHKLPVRAKYTNVTLKRGMDRGHDLFTWYKNSLEGRLQRKNISIMVYGPEGGEPMYQWDLMGAFPVKWVGPDMRTEAGSSAIETLEFAHHGLINSTHRSS